MPVHFAFTRLADGPAVGLVDTPADLPSVPLDGLRVGDEAVVLNPRGTWQLKPVAASTTLSAVIAAGQAGLEWVQIGPPGPPGPAGPAGPLPPEFVVAPVVDQELVVALPDVTTQPDGTLRFYAFNGKDRGAAVGVITAFAGQFVGRAGLNWYRLSENGTVLLRAVPASGLWDIAGEERGTPQDLALTVDPGAGLDTNPGTVARPLASAVAAFGLAARTPWRRFGKATAVGAGVDDSGDTPYMVPAGVGPSASPFQMVGTVFTVAPGFAASYVTNGVGTAFSAGPPLVLTRFAIAATPEFGADGARGFFVRPTNGPLAGVRLAVVASTTTTVDVAGGFLAPGNGTHFVVEEPAYSLDSSTLGCTLRPGSGTALQLQGMALGASSRIDVRVGVTVVMYGSKSFGDTLALYAAVAASGDFASADGSLAAAVEAAFNAIAPPAVEGAIIVGSVQGDASSAVLAEATEFANVTTGTEAVERPYVQWFSARCGMTGALRYAGGAMRLADHAMRDGTLILSQAGSAILTNLDFLNTAPGADGVVADFGSTARLTNVRGTVTAGRDPVSAQHGSHVTVTDANAGTTISDGAGRNAIVGVLGNRSWALIAGNLYANINDNAGAPAGGTGSTIAPG